MLEVKQTQGIHLLLIWLLPKTQEYIYIKKTDAQGYSTVVSLEVKDGDLLLDYTDPVITKSFFA